MAHWRWRFVRFANDEKASTTLEMLARCFEAMGGVPKVVLADRMGSLKGGVVANIVVPTPAYVRFASSYGFRPDFCQAHDPESKGIVENLVGYAKSDLVVPQGFADAAVANEAAPARCDEVNWRVHSEICAVPAERLEAERPLVRRLPSLRPSFGREATRKVDRLSCVRFGSARYPVPTKLIRRSLDVEGAGKEVAALNSVPHNILHDCAGLRLRDACFTFPVPPRPSSGRSSSRSSACSPSSAARVS